MCVCRRVSKTERAVTEGGAIRRLCDVHGFPSSCTWPGQTRPAQRKEQVIHDVAVAPQCVAAWCRAHTHKPAHKGWRSELADGRRE
jgi:hypothetical protein